MQSTVTTPIASGSTDQKPCNNRLQVAIVVGAEEIPFWIGDCIRQLQRSQLVDVAAVLVLNSRQGANSLIVRPLRHLVFRIYRWIDTLVFPSRANPAEKHIRVKDLEDVGMVVSSPNVQSCAAMEGRRGYAFLDDLDLDLVLHLAPSPPDSRLGATARHGVWSLCHSPGATCYSPFDGFWEVIDCQSVTESRLIAVDGHPNSAPRLLAQAFTRTCAYSANRNRDRIRWRGVDLLVQCLTELRHERPVDGAKTAICNPAAPDDNREPTNLRLLRSLPPLVWSIMKRSIAAVFTVEYWSLAVEQLPTKDPQWKPDPTRLRELRPPKGSFWADPVALERGGKAYVFAEELVYEKQRGHLVVIELDEQGQYERHTPILIRDHHLSYPFVFEWEGEVYMTPENSSTNTVDLYRCCSFPEKWELVQPLLTDVSGVDPTLFRHEGKWWMFLAQGRTNFDELHIYSSDDLLGPWTAHAQNPVKSDARSSRPAGPIFTDGAHLYRPSQDCSPEYGYAIVVNRITKLTTTEYEEEEVQKILPTWRRDLRGTHMLSHTPKFAVIDQKFRQLRFRA